MPKTKLDPQMKEIRRQTNLSFVEIADISLVEYIARYDFKEARRIEALNRKSIIRFAIKKHGKGAKKVLYKLRIPIKPEEIGFYKKALRDGGIL